MLKIIVCDDDSFTLKLIAGLLEKAITESRINASVVCLASSGSELLRYIADADESYLYFLDFDFGKTELNGIDLVRRIYEKDAGGKIVFVTSHADKGMDILRSGVQAFGFIEKSSDLKKMRGEFTRYLKMMRSEEQSRPEEACIKLPLGIDETVKLSLSEIAYVDSVKTIAHSICYHTFDGSEITVRDTMEHALQLLGGDFIRCHRSVIVNRKHIIAVKNGSVKLSNAITLPLALSKKKEVLASCASEENNYD